MPGHAGCHRECGRAQALRRWAWCVPSHHTFFFFSPEADWYHSEARLANELERIERAFPRHLVVFAGSRRQDDSAPEPAPSPSPPAEGILARYQLLTPALISGLLLTFFVLIPIVLFGVYALASIQSPLRVNAPKGYSADEKKNQ